MKNKKLDNLDLDKKQITKLTNLNSIWGGTGTLVDENTNPYNTTVPDTNTEPENTGHTTLTTFPTAGGGDPIGKTKTVKGKTTSKLC